MLRQKRTTVGLLTWARSASSRTRSEEHTSELQSQSNLVCRLLLEKKKKLIARRLAALTPGVQLARTFDRGSRPVAPLDPLVPPPMSTAGGQPALASMLLVRGVGCL